MTKRLDIDAMDAGDAIDLVAQLDAARDQLDRDTDTLEILAEIKDDLRSGIAQRQLRMEGDALTDWEREFLSSIRSWPRPLTEKQSRMLKTIVARLRRNRHDR